MVSWPGPPESHGSARAAPPVTEAAAKLRITAATIRAIVFNFIKGLRSIGGGRG